MNLLVISDLHIDNGDKFGAFGWKPKRFIKALDTVIEQNEIDKVVLNGDIFELYKYNFNDVYRWNRELIGYFNKREFVYIRGNHDIFNPLAKESLTISNGKGQTIYIEHGHNADFLNGTKLGRFISIAAFNALKKLIKLQWIEKLYFRVIEWDDQINRIPKKYNTFRYLNYALKLLRNYDVVILGHTHKLEAHKTYYLNTKKIYLNTGSCSLGRFQAVILDTETLKYDTIKISRSDMSKKLIKKTPKRSRLSIPA
ncbi:MAG: metallophosphoesterase family protein [Bacteroidales bacterium]